MLVRRGLSLAAVVLFTGTMLFLGRWQHDKAIRREALATRIAERGRAAPLVLANAEDLRALSESDDCFRSAVLYGRFGRREARWFAGGAPAATTAREEIGRHVLSPFFFRDGSAMLVDRGVRAAVDASETFSDDPLKVVLRCPDRRGPFDNADEPLVDLFYVRDPRIIGRHWELDLPVVFGDASTADDRLSMRALGPSPERHRGYALTWYAFAVALPAALVLRTLRAYGSGRRL